MIDLKFTASEQPKMAAFNERFGKLNELYEYFWRRRLPAGQRYVEKQADTTGGKLAYSETIQYASSISIDQTNGEITLTSPASLAVNSGNALSGAAAQTLCDAAPCYVKSASGLFYLPENADQGYLKTLWYDDYSTSDDSYYGISMTSKENVQRAYASGANNGVWARVITSQMGNLPAGEWEYFHSTDRDAYPDSGTQDGYEWEFVGVPFENALSGSPSSPKVAIGSYTGTGAYGNNNSNSLMFSFEPKFLFLLRVPSTYRNSYANTEFAFFMGLTESTTQYYSCVDTSSSNGGQMRAVREGNAVSWFSASAASAQLNTLNAQYCYLAIG